MNPIVHLLHTFRVNAENKPRLTWYGPSDERIELSGKVLALWAAKTANYLTEEFDASPGQRTQLAMPPHWKSLAIALGVLASGSTLMIHSSTHDFPGTDVPSVAFYSDLEQLSLPENASPSPGLEPQIVAVAPAALATHWAGELPQGFHDYVAEVRGFADIFEPLEFPDAQDPAIISAETELTFQQLEQCEPRGLRSLPPEATHRYAISAEATFLPTLQSCLAIWSAGGSVLLFSGSEISPEILAAEQATLWSESD